MSEWDLFGFAWVAMALAALVAAAPGAVVVARGQIMLAVAASQSAACGAACAMFLIGLTGSDHVHGDLRIHMGALVGGLAGTGLAWSVNQERVAWIFAAASAGTVLFVADSPYGMHDILALQHSNALLAGFGECIIFVLLLLITAVLLSVFHRPIRLIAIDPAHAKRCGLRVRRWELCIGCWLGIIISIAVSTFGLLATFGWLLLPTIMAMSLVRNMWALFLVAPLCSLVVTVAAIIAGHQMDIPPGQTVVALLAIACVIVFVISKIARQRQAKH